MNTSLLCKADICCGIAKSRSTNASWKYTAVPAALEQGRLTLEPGEWCTGCCLFLYLQLSTTRCPLLPALQRQPPLGCCYRASPCTYPPCAEKHVITAWRRFQGDLIMAFSTSRGCTGKMGTDDVADPDAKGQGVMVLSWKRVDWFDLDTQKNIFILWVVPRFILVVDAPSPDTFKVRLIKALSNLI